MRLVEIEDNTNLLEKYKDEVNFALDKYNQGIVIYRGSGTYSQDIIYKDPTTLSTDRKSANAWNYYTLWLSNNPQWAAYPKRNRSLICSTSYDKAASYENPVVIVPLINCKIGVCPAGDIWDSFKLVGNLHMFMKYVWFLFWKHDKHRFDGFSYQEMMQKLHEMTPEKFGKFGFDKFDNLMVKFNNNAEAMLQNVFDPVDNNFTLTSWKQFNILGDREVWLSAPCLLIKPEIFNRLAEDRKNAIG